MSAKSGTSVEQTPLKDKSIDKSKQRQRDEKRDRKKDDKSVEHVLKALNSLETTEEKLAAMCKKYADIFNDHRMLQNVTKQAEKRCGVLQREKEQLQAEHSKAILTRSRLENLCRELQRQNKAVKEESMMRIREEEEKRKEVSAKFQSTLSEITAMMQANNDKNTKLRDDNIDMTQKLKSVYEQYERREQHVEKLAKQMQLEVQLAEAKLAKAKMEMAVEKETLLREKQQLLIEIAEYKSRLEEMQGTEQSLRTQITLYNNKYDEFHRALIQSNEAISGFKAEMDRMSKQIRRLERETGAWRGRYEGTQAALARMTEEKLRLEAELGTAGRKLAALQRLCHTLQDYRRATAKGENTHSDATLKAQMEEVKALEECPSKAISCAVQRTREMETQETTLQNGPSENGITETETPKGEEVQTSDGETKKSENDAKQLEGKENPIALVTSYSEKDAPTVKPEPLDTQRELNAKLEETPVMEPLVDKDPSLGVDLVTDVKPLPVVESVPTGESLLIIENLEAVQSPSLSETSPVPNSSELICSNPSESPTVKEDHANVLEEIVSNIPQDNSLENRTDFEVHLTNADSQICQDITPQEEKIIENICTDNNCNDNTNNPKSFEVVQQDIFCPKGEITIDDVTKEISSSNSIEVNCNNSTELDTQLNDVKTKPINNTNKQSGKKKSKNNGNKTSH